jgi:hypothetical protein
MKCMTEEWGSGTICNGLIPAPWKIRSLEFGAWYSSDPPARGYIE